MISASRVAVGSGGRLLELDTTPPMTVRRVHGAPGVCTLCAVGSAAGPLAGDDIHLRLTVGAGARAAFTSTGASLAQGRAGREASVITHRVDVAAAGELVAEPPPLVVCAGSNVRSVLELDLDATATVRWLDVLVLGRSGEPAGAVELDSTVRRDGRTVLRQTLDLGRAATRGWAGLLGGARVVVTCFVAGPQLQMATMVDDATAVAQRLDDHAGLITVLDTDAAAAHKRAIALLARATAQ